MAGRRPGDPDNANRTWPEWKKKLPGAAFPFGGPVGFGLLSSNLPVIIRGPGPRTAPGIGDFGFAKAITALKRAASKVKDLAEILARVMAAKSRRAGKKILQSALGLSSEIASAISKIIRSVPGKIREIIKSVDILIDRIIPGIEYPAGEENPWLQEEFRWTMMEIYSADLEHACNNFSNPNIDKKEIVKQLAHILIELTNWNANMITGDKPKARGIIHHAADLMEEIAHNVDPERESEAKIISDLKVQIIDLAHKELGLSKGWRQSKYSH